MKRCLLNLPNELLDMILFDVIDRPWKNDVRDFLSFTSTCRELRRLFHDERYWKRMALRRDSNCEIPPKIGTWFEHCQQVYSQRTIPGDELIETISRYNDKYFCTIEKVLIWPNRIRVYIDERGDNSLGDIQDPVHSTLGFVVADSLAYNPSIRIKPDGAKFLIADAAAQYLGYLDFPCTISVDTIGKSLAFQYGIGGYTNAKIYHIDPTFINKHNLTPLFQSVQHFSPDQVLTRAKSR